LLRQCLIRIVHWFCRLCSIPDKLRLTKSIF